MKKTKTNLSKCLAISIVYMNSMNPHLYGSQSSDEDQKEFSQKRKIDETLIEGKRSWSQLQNFSGSKKTIEISDSLASRTGNTSSPQTKKVVKKNTNIDREVPAPPLVSGSRLMEEENVREDRSSKKGKHYPEKNQKKKSHKKPRMGSSKSPSPQTKKFTKRDKDIEEPAPVLLSDEPIDTENALGDDSKPHLEIVPQENKQESQEKGLGLPKIKTRSLPLEEEAQGDHTGYTGQTALPEKEKQEKHVSHKNGKQENVREFNSDESQESDDYEADYIEGVLDDEKKELLQSSKYLNLYGIYLPRGIKDHKYFKGDSLEVFPKTINPNVVSLRLNLCGLRDDNIIDIGDFKKLKKLELPANKITDEGIKYITRLSKLEVLNLCNNFIADEGVKEIAKMPALKTLNLSSNKEVSNQGMDYLRENTTLENLTIHLTKVSLEKYKDMKLWQKFKNLD